MTFNNTTKIALIASIMVLPIGFGSAYADGSAEIVAVCGFDAPNDVPMGMIVYGADGDENNFSIDVNGNGVGTLELEASDWRGTESLEYAQMIIDLNPDIVGGDRILFGNTIDIQGSTSNSGQTFDAASNVEGDANNFVITMNANPSYPGTAEHIGDGIVVITSKHPQGHIWNGGYEIADIPITLTVTQNSDGFEMLTDGFVYEQNIIVLPAETTRYSVTTDGTPSDGTTYLEKSPLAPTEQNVVLTTEAFRDNPINLTFQLTGIDVLDDVDYTGAIQQTWTFTYSCTE